ncbi:MAG: hypothetical protein IT182_19230 [Acidobacteria bacterium]|nr:hypothetical protein [Acidobacteriota bacterium]
MTNPLAAIGLGGLLAGLGDFLFALAYYGTGLRVFQNVTAGLVGREAAYAGGVPAYVIGVVLHFLIATIWAAIYVFTTRMAPSLNRRPIPSGLLYGAIVFYGMNCIVLPLSALRAAAWPPPWAPVPLAMHMLVVGLPIAIVAARSRAA